MIRHVEIVGQSNSFVFTIRESKLCPPGQIGFSAPQRKWAMISVDLPITVKPMRYDLKTQSVSIMTVEFDFISKKK